MYPVINKKDLQPVLVHFLSGRSAMTNFLDDSKITKEEASKLWNSQVYITPATLCHFSVANAKFSQCVENPPLLTREYFGDFSLNDFTAFVINRQCGCGSEIDISGFMSGYHILESSWKHYQLLISAKYVQQ